MTFTLLLFLCSPTQCQQLPVQVMYPTEAHCLRAAPIYESILDKQDWYDKTLVAKAACIRSDDV